VVKVVDLAGEAHAGPVGEMSAMGKIHGENGVAGRDQCRVGSDIGLGSRMRLDIGVIRSEQFHCARASMLLGLIHHLAAAVVTTPGVSFGVLVGQYRTLCGQHGIADDILACDQVDLTLLASLFPDDDVGDFRVRLIDGYHR